MSRRVMVRLPEQIEAWLIELGGDRATTLKALAVLGALQLGLPGAEREARRLLAGEPGPRAAEALAATWQPHGSHMAASAEMPVPEPPAHHTETLLAELLEDPFAVGVEV